MSDTETVPLTLKPLARNENPRSSPLQSCLTSDTLSPKRSIRDGRRVSILSTVASRVEPCFLRILKADLRFQIVPSAAYRLIQLAKIWAGNEPHALITNSSQRSSMPGSSTVAMT